MTAAPMTLAELLAASRAFACREAIVATLARLLPAVEVKSLPGRIGMDGFFAHDRQRGVDPRQPLGERQFRLPVSYRDEIVGRLFLDLIG